MTRLHWLALSCALALTALLRATPAQACKCMLPTVDAARQDSSAIFEGRVLGVQEQAAENAMPVHRVTLAVVRTWKGLERDEQIDVFTNTQSASCGYTFAKETSYLVYARESEGRLHVSLCSRTRPLADASEDLVALGAGSTPVHIAPKASRTDGGISADAAPAGGDSKAATASPSKGAGAAAKKRGCSAAPVPSTNGATSFGALLGLAAFGLLVRRRRC
jgi:uncharacterized protein (TIGR03382 family)